MSGLSSGSCCPRRTFVDSVVAGLGIVMADVGFLLLGVSWPRTAGSGARRSR